MRPWVKQWHLLSTVWKRERLVVSGSLTGSFGQGHRPSKSWGKGGFRAFNQRFITIIKWKFCSILFVLFNIHNIINIHRRTLVFRLIISTYYFISIRFKDNMIYWIRIFTIRLYTTTIFLKACSLVPGEQPAAMQHGGQLRLEYPISVFLLSATVTFLS